MLLWKKLLAASDRLADEVDALNFAPPTAAVYNPLRYARRPLENYLKKWAGPAPVLWLGMNPGPFGMAQTGIPFGEINAARDWLQVEGEVDKPAGEHPKRPIEGFNITRSEVSGRRLWALFADRFGTPEQFFQGNFVGNYCPLVFMEASGRNRTPDKLPKEEREALFACCDTHLQTICKLLGTQTVAAVGRFAEERALQALKEFPVKIIRILHPSPANPHANRGWAAAVEQQLTACGLWEPR